MQELVFGDFTVLWVPRGDWDDSSGRNAGVYTGPQNFHALVPHHGVMGDVVTDNFALVCQKMLQLKYIRPDLGSEVPYNWATIKHPNPNFAWLCEGRGLGWTGAHTQGYNSSVHAVCYWGNSNVDVITPGILEAMRYCGRLMYPYVTQPTYDHNWYNDDTACAGDGLRALLPELQPPFTTPNAPVNPPEPEIELSLTKHLPDNWNSAVGGPWRRDNNAGPRMVDFSLLPVNAQIVVRITGDYVAPTGTNNFNAILVDAFGQQGVAVANFEPAVLTTNHAGRQTVVIPESAPHEKITVFAREIS